MKKYLIAAAALILAAGTSLQAADVKENWTKHCAKCHGDDGKGDTKMGKKLKVKDYTSATVQAEFKDDLMFKAIKEGLKEDGKTKMKAFGEELPDAEIQALVKYVRGLKK